MGGIVAGKGGGKLEIVSKSTDRGEAVFRPSGWRAKAEGGGIDAEWLCDPGFAWRMAGLSGKKNNKNKKKKKKKEGTRPQPPQPQQFKRKYINRKGKTVGRCLIFGKGEGGKGEGGKGERVGRERGEGG